MKMPVDTVSGDGGKGRRTTGGLTRRVTRLLADRNLADMAGAFAIKTGMVAVNFALITLAARVLGPTRFGIYSMVFSAVGLVAVVATFGQQIFLLRAWNEHVATDDGPGLKASLTFSATLVLAGCVLAFPALGGTLYVAHGTSLALAASTYLVIFVLLQAVNHLVRTAIGMIAGDGLANFAMFVPAVVYLAFVLVTGGGCDIADIFMLLALGAGAALVTQVAMAAYRIRRQFPAGAQIRSHTFRRSWIHRSLKLWFSTSLEAVNQFLDVLMIGLLLSPSLAGAYFVTTRIANIFLAAADSANIMTTRRIPDLFFHRRFGELARLLDVVAGVTLAVIVVGLVAIAIGGSWLLVLIDPDTARFYPWLLVLCLGTAALAAAGPSAPLLMITGNEGRYLAVIGAGVALRIAGFVVLTPLFGLAGAAVATTVSYVAIMLLLRAAAIGRTALDPTPLRVFAKHRRAQGDTA
ncbi:lipopolysaccharide biosynthesis protein [Pararhizobium mangrovi]|uniref:Lipopolysaccharide biosynthesis protein n=1 Tax=Pararhizobium mangrovi TaxID=2590452 RepID=A0A506TW65_9HYPH|nr:lipopolysaccharide biosynthesis protein [Pararhizobium mangrovi]TPW26312.1 lipopolysaccharide biosynthesis protein [Pararhizobium mangrovi]